MTSREIAPITGKQHKHVMEAIRVMEPSWEKQPDRNFDWGIIRMQTTNSDRNKF
ncbi:Rha family transcriptional regulator [Draconibacterium sp. IB214405]|uniref:Rha family transcriptional regulator n=1 Tax=Draconibacterium sp. IB214405 TaxID=3097352 RepID=UPI003FA43644